MRALIFEGKIVDFADVDFPVVPEMTWAEAPAGATRETHIYNGAAVVSRPSKTQAEIDAEVSALARVKLAAIDAKSIRSIREYIAAKADAPLILKTYETDAQAERVKIKP